MENTWSIFKTKPATASIYTDDATVIYVPTGAGARGSAQIRRFYLHPHFSEKVNKLKEHVHNKVTGGNKIIEEVEWSVTFHTGECSWLTPDLGEHFLVISAAFEGDQIASLRIHWDQACILKQLRVITDKNNWPVRGVEQLEALRSIKSTQLTPLDSEPPVEHKVQKHEQNTYMPGRIFGPVKPEDEVRRPVRRRDPNEVHRNIFTYEPPAPRPLVAHNPKRLDSSITFGDEPRTPEPTEDPSKKTTSQQGRDVLSHSNTVDSVSRSIGAMGLSASDNTSNRRRQPPPTR
ncbi:hypothetical protein EC973_007633 [Apophysomyces ossiformis]|uniref:SnoaL-like domain-containing protein n=1 Tax=Apophysomyces ossiformis TaxID=679940 RepID=A0A8H7BPH4_9FUNG|nr:hypothetical protein EC973_007633 [Apophysomyces ossiformis]